MLILFCITLYNYNQKILPRLQLPEYSTGVNHFSETELSEIELANKEFELQQEFKQAWLEASSNISYTDIDMLAKTIYGEGGNQPIDQQAAIAWCVLNRVDMNIYPDTIPEVITQYKQFTGYHDYTQYTQSHFDLAKDVIIRRRLEKSGYTNVGRTLPKSCYAFRGDGKHNNFRIPINGKNYKDGYTIWNWSYTSPYN